MADAQTKKHPTSSVQTTGHAWDGDLQEFNNPLPRWWLWAFYATVVFALVYWLFYPAWPYGHSYTKGVLNTITYQADGEERTTHWNTRALLAREMQQGEAAVRQRQHMQEVAAADYEQILQSPEMMGFTLSVGDVLFADNCAACHGAGGQGKLGLFPNLVDDAWLWGGSVEAIHETISQGRRGFMPPFANTLTDVQLDQVTEYVLSLSGHGVDTAKADKGRALFGGERGGCYYCHTREGTGRASQGAADLTDSVWTVARVPGQSDLDGRRAAVREVIESGVNRVMPAWKDRLSATEIKLLTVYVYNLGGSAP